MKTETSAGGVIVCWVNKQWYVFIIKDMNDTWTFPKGLIEERETPERAAIREIFEETGIGSLELLAPLPMIRYGYTRNGSIQKTVQYFIFLTKIRRKPVIQKEEGIRDARWLPINRAIGIIGYRQTNVSLLEETWKLLKRRTLEN